ncbi:cytochrome P450 [Sinosporangium siamense]|uniref:Cytochrome P450 n=1 Tax=Sinosporangium siamense TaxID=1367973 RepID=A0A919RHF0_9ACTN|nr:cytochrome P450 [Sinosporangium siamense]GII92855.1 cytochrome P450 [Sinosporangium siamense]
MTVPHLTPQTVLPYPFSDRPTVLDPPSTLAWVHDEPVLRITLPSGDGAWLVTRYDDVRTLLNDRRLTRDLSRPGTPRMSKENILFQDPNVKLEPPDHPRMRRLVARAFTAARVERLRPYTQGVVDEILDGVEAAGPPADLQSTLSFPLAIRILCELLGVPTEDQKEFTAWAEVYLSLGKYPAAEVAKNDALLTAYMTDLIEAKRANPGDDLLSGLIAARDEGSGKLSDYELFYWAKGLLMGGYETTANHLGASMVTLLTNPGLLARLRADPELVPRAVEEMLRIQVLFHSIASLRYVKEDVEVAGTVIPRGAGIILAMESANYDEAAFPNPSEVDLDRPARPHLAFSSGPHHCAGSALARMELQVGIGRLLARFPTLALACAPLDLRRADGVFIEGFVTVPVTW